MHYAVSNGNFDVVSVLLDSKVCDINKQNKVRTICYSRIIALVRGGYKGNCKFVSLTPKAGYTSVMLVSLAEIKSQTHKEVVQKLFQLGDVNIKATQVKNPIIRRWDK